MKKKKYPIVHIAFSHPSFQWGNGLYIILGKRGNELQMCKVSKEGKPELYDDGRYMVTITGAGNEGITKTNLSYTGKVYEG